MKEPVTPPTAAAGAPPAIELRHLRYFVALADAGSFTDAAERIFITQPTLSQQIRRLEEIVGTQLLQRHRQGLRLTKAGAVLLDASRTVLSLVDHEVDRTRQAAGLGRPRLRVVVPPRLPNAFAVQAAPALRSVATAADVEIVWLQIPLDAEFRVIRQRRADAGLGWLTEGPEALAAPLEAVSLGEFGPDVWIPSAHPAARRATIGLGELVRMDVIHGPRRAEPGTYDAWTRVLRTVDPRFEFTDPPLRHSLAMDLAFAATADRPTAVLTGPVVSNGNLPGPARQPRPMVAHDMVRVGLQDHLLTATAALAWSRDLPRQLQQILFDAAETLSRRGTPLIRYEVSGTCMGTRKRRTSCGQPQATAIFPAHSRAASSSATSTTAKPPRCSLDSMNGPSVNSGVPLEASTLNTGAASSRPPVKIRTPAAFISATRGRSALDFSRSSSIVWSGTHSSLKAMRYSVMSPPLPGGPGWAPSTCTTNGGTPIRHRVSRDFYGRTPD
jgi:DNA-binding transcriptional LysR family regulator